MDINDLLFALYSIEVFLDFELCVFFLMKGKPKATRHIAILGLAYAFFGITRIFLIFWDFESVPPHTGYEMLYIIGAFFAFLAMSVFLHAAETLIRKTKHVFTICFLALSGIIPVLPYKTVQSIYYFFTPVLIFFVIIFLFLLMAMTSGSTRKKFFFVSIGLIVFGLGYALSTAFMKAIINNAILPPSLVLVGLTLTGIGFINIPSLYEIHWDDSLLHIFVFHIDTSVCIYDETLIKVGKESNISADLFSSGVTGIINIIKEMVQSDKKLKVLDHEDKKILLEYGKHITVALVAIKDLNTLHEKLHTYIERTETDFKKQFEKWNGEVTKFAPALKTITNEILKTKLDPNWWRLDFKKISRDIKTIFDGKKNTGGTIVMNATKSADDAAAMEADKEAKRAAEEAKRKADEEMARAEAARKAEEAQKKADAEKIAAEAKPSESPASQETQPAPAKKAVKPAASKKKK